MIICFHCFEHLMISSSMREFFIKAVSTLVNSAKELANLGCDSPWVRGLPDIRRGEDEGAQAHQQARQLRVQIVLYQARPVGHRVRHIGREYPSNNSTEQVTMSSTARWV